MSKINRVAAKTRPLTKTRPPLFLIHSFRKLHDMDSELKRAIATAEIRSMFSSIQKATTLVSKLGHPTAAVARIYGLDRCRVRRAVIAHQSGRELGSNGRPKKLSKDQEERLKQIVEKRVLEHRSPSKSEVAFEV